MRQSSSPVVIPEPRLTKEGRITFVGVFSFRGGIASLSRLDGFRLSVKINIGWVCGLNAEIGGVTCWIGGSRHALWFGAEVCR
jgi:hypothetical protein